MLNQKVSQAYLKSRLLYLALIRQMSQTVGDGRLLIFLVLALLLLPQLATAQTNDISFRLQWNAIDAHWTGSVAWGDYDNDGDLDLAVGNG